MKLNFKIYVLFYFAMTYAYCQNDIAKRLFDQQNYKAAIKILEKEQGSIANEILLIKSYQKLLKYKYANIALDKALSLYTIDKKDYDALLVLKLNALVKDKNFEEAASTYKQYKSILSRNQDALKISKLLEDIETWKNLEKQFQISPLKRINSESNDYAMTQYKSDYYFVSSRDKDLINGNQLDPNAKQAYSQLFKASKDKDENAYKNNGKTIPMISGAYNQGPIAFDTTHGLAYYSMSTSKDGVHYYNQLFCAQQLNSKWLKPNLLAFNLSQYNFLHPCISNSGKYLFFSSNMLGGFGGYDLYVVEKKDEAWGTPINLGATINTNADEVFPFYDEEAMLLYFSSNTFGGMGGLDIYAIKVNNKFKSFYSAFNLREPLNSNADDFAFNRIPNSNKGFFASDREGGLGGDDIYQFSMRPNLSHAQYIFASDRAGDKKLAQVKVKLFENGKLIAAEPTNSKGEIVFPMLDKEKLYTLKIDKTEQTPSAYILNLKYKPVLEAKESDKLLVFENINSDISALDDLNAEIEVGNMTIKAMVVAESDFEKPIKNLKIELVNEGDVVYQSRISDNNGSFMFTQLDPSSSFKFKMDEELLNYLSIGYITIYTMDKKLLATIKLNKEKKYEYKILPADLVLLSAMTEDDVPYAINLEGYLKGGDNNQKLLPMVDVLLYNEKGELLQRTKTNHQGFFKFQKLAPDQNYLISTDVEDPIWKDISNLSIVDKSGKVIYKQTNKNVSELFNFPILANDQSRLSIMQEEDITLNLKIQGVLLGDGTKPLSYANIFLNNGIGQIDKTTTDINGHFKFENVPLNTEVKLGIDSNELLFKPFSELLIKDLKGKIIYRASKSKFVYTFLSSDQSSLSILNESDESSFVPAILTIQVLNDQGQALVLRNIQIVNNRGKVVFDGKTDANGKITLSNLNLNENYNIVLLTGNEKFTSALALADANGNILKRGYLAKDGTYKFTLLSSEMKEIANPISEGAAFKLINQVMNWNNIYFDFGKFEISENSAIELDKLVSYLKLDPRIHAEVDAHTDVVSSDQFNLALSKKRLDAVMKYISNKGISQKRLIGKYFGEAKPIQKKTSEAEYSEADNNLNRRAEFKLFVK